MKKHARRLTLNRETLRRLAGEALEDVAGGIVTQPCPCTHTCASCSPCTIGQSTQASPTTTTTTTSGKAKKGTTQDKTGRKT